MTDKEKMKKLSDFEKPKESEEQDWTEEEILAVAKKIIERMGLDEQQLR